LLTSGGRNNYGKETLCEAEQAASYDARPLHCNTSFGEEYVRKMRTIVIPEEFTDFG
jgi:hypothetical protein